jgi:hypothetical protein
MFNSPEELQAKIRLGEDSVIELKAVHMKGSRVDAPNRMRQVGNLDIPQKAFLDDSELRLTIYAAKPPVSAQPGS